MKIETYEVRVKQAGSFFWTKYKNVTGDNTLYVGTKEQPVFFPVRVLFFKDGSRVEIPLFNCLVEYSKDRFEMIEQNIKENKG
jgi:hypothetical protein